MRSESDSHTERILVYGGKGWIGSQFCKLLKSMNITFILAQMRPGDDTDECVKNELIQVNVKNHSTNTEQQFAGGTQSRNIIHWAHTWPRFKYD